MRTNKTGYVDKRSWVVYTDPVGRTDPGIYYREVSVDGKRAFVHPRGSGKRADVIPSANVFRTEAEARRFHASDGAEKWVVVFECACNSPFDKRVPTVVHARVKTFTDEHGHPYKNIVEIGRGPRDKRFHTDRYDNWPAFDTAREAYAYQLGSGST